MRTPFIAANWKMNLLAAEIDPFCGALGALAAEHPGVKVGVFPSFVHLPRVVEALAGSPAVVGAQTCHDERAGAFTGAVSAWQVRDVGATHVIVGHSERRTLFGEDDDAVRARLDAALEAGLDAILCLGETLAQRESGATGDVIRAQLDAGLSGLPGETVADRVTVAYEPVWAIGTGEVATPEQAQEAHRVLRERAAELIGEPSAERLVIQYGGSVKPDNVADLMARPDVDGALVGGASLEFESFSALVAYEGAGSRP